MKTLLILAMILLFSGFAQADLLNRMNLEDTLRLRIEEVMKIYDPQAKVLLRFDLKKFDDVLPGTSITQDSDSSPIELGSRDIARVMVEIYTSIDPLPTEARDMILKVLPIEKGKIAIQYKKNQTEERNVPGPLDEKGLERIASEVVNKISRVILGIFATGLLVFLGSIIFINTRRNKEMKKHLEQLSSAISEISTGSSHLNSRDVQALPMPTTSVSGVNNSKQFEDVSSTSLQELFADCYWCHKDGYAHWLWQQLSSPRRREILSSIPFLKEYSQFFIDITPKEESYHSHPYYLDPFFLSKYSQEDLSKVVERDLSFWHRLSPLRQGHLVLPLEFRLKAIETPPREGAAPELKNSTPRNLERKSNWTELNIEDELILFDNPEMVPIHLRSNIKTLVWFAKKPKALVEDTLSRYDARTLAQIWVGPDALLKTLETHLPEKKLKLLVNYRQKLQPTRHHPAFTSLMQEGLKDDVA